MGGSRLCAQAAASAREENTASLIERMNWWIEENRRDKRAPHEYTLEKFGLSKDEIRRDFAEYRRRYIEG